MTEDARVVEALRAIADEPAETGDLWTRVVAQRDQRLRTAKRRRTALAIAAVLAVVAGPAVWLARSGDSPRSHVAITNDNSRTEPGWHEIAEAPIEGRRSAVVATDGRSMFAWGGFPLIATRSFSDGALYDPVTDTWRTVPPAPSPLTGGGKAIWDGTRFLVLSPTDTDVPVSLAAFDPAAETWEKLADPPLGPRDGFEAVWTGSQLVVAGGVTGDQRATPFGATYDAESNSWRVMPETPGATFALGPAVWDGARVVFAGGLVPSTSDSSASAAVTGVAFTPGDPGTWSDLSPTPLTLSQWAVPTTDGIAAFSAGYDSPLLDGARYVSAQDSWTAAPTLEANGAVLRVIEDGAGGWVVISEAGGAHVSGQSVKVLPSVDFHERATSAMVVASNHVVLWGVVPSSSGSAAGAQGYAMHL